MESKYFVPGKTDTDALVVFFSSSSLKADKEKKSGNTEAMAKEIAKQTGADRFELVSGDKHYPGALIKITSVAKRDLKENARPAYMGNVTDFSKYKTVFIGGPIWYLEWPMIIYTFLESHDLTGKQIVPFGTYVGTSGIERLAKQLQEIHRESSVFLPLSIKGAEAHRMNDKTRKKIAEWLSAMEV